MGIIKNYFQRKYKYYFYVANKIFSDRVLISANKKFSKRDILTYFSKYSSVYKITRGMYNKSSGFEIERDFIIILYLISIKYLSISTHTILVPTID